MNSVFRVGEIEKFASATLPALKLPLYVQLSLRDGKNWNVGELIAEFLKTRDEKRNERKAGERDKRMRDRWVTEPHSIRQD
jgi:hypothetical protein